MKNKRIEKLNILLLLLIVASVGLLLTSTTQSTYQPTEQLTEKEELLIPEIVQRFDLVGDGFHLLYDELAMPNTLELINMPVITGNTKADVYIRELAESRGYTKRRVAQSEIELLPVSESELLQPQAQQDFLQLARAAEDEGIEIRVRSGFRSIDYQRDIFIFRLESLGINVNQITSGTQDVALNELLRTTAPPGYSRHQTGYTVDLASGDTAFVLSSGYTWISKNNFENALKHGFIPSYPLGAIDQGPDPEAWEFVWVGIDLIQDQLQDDDVQ